MLNQALIYIEDKVLAIAGKRLQDLGFPTLQRYLGDRLGREMLRETIYDVDELNEYALANEPLLAPDQRNFYVVILNLVNEKKGWTAFP